MSTRHTLRKHGLYALVLVAAALTGRLLATAELSFGGWVGL
ncbi:hypothetical protein [Novosphingobium sp. ZW T3_23]